MNIGIAVHSMQVGGSERVLSILANSWVDAGHKVSIFTFDNSRNESFYKLSSGVEHRKLGIATGKNGGLSQVSSLVKKYYGFRKTMQKESYDVLISFTSEINILVLAATMGLKVPVVVSERSDPRVIPKGTLWRSLRRVLYHRLPSAIVVQNKYAAEYFDGKVRTRLVSIPNPIVANNTTAESTKDNDAGTRIIAVGRLVREKRYDLLIEATHKLLCSDRGEDIELILIGDGPMQGALEKTVERLGMKNSVKLAGFSTDPWRDVNHGDIYVQCSDFEGFPNALCEAMSRGCAVISTVYSSAVTEIISDKVNGILVPRNNVPALYEAMKSLVSSSALRKDLGDEARKIIHRFDPEKIASVWIRGLEEVTANVS